jgi:Tol biopolymer transport system component
MAPEQIRRERSDARADQFAWGVVAYELLAGKLPWVAGRDSVPLLMAVLEQQPTPLADLTTGIPDAFTAAVMRALSKRAEERFPSMTDLITSLGYPGDESRPSLPGSIPSSRADRSGPFFPPADISSAPTMPATKSGGSLATSAVTAVARAGRARKRRVVVTAVLAAAISGAAALYVVPRLRTSSVGAPPSGSANTPPPFAFDPRDPRRLTFDQGCEEYPSLSPDAKTVVFDSAIGDDTHIVALDIPSGTERRITTEPGWHFAPVVSPDGLTVAYMRQHGDEVGTWTVPLDQSSPARLFAAGRMRPSYSPDGRALWAGPPDSPRRIDLASGETTRTLVAPAGYFILRVRELADGRVVGRLLDRETKRGRGLVLYGASSTMSVPLFTPDTEDAFAVAPDRNGLIVSKFLPTQKVELWRVPLDSEPPARVLSNVALATKGIDVARDGSLVVWSTCSTEQDIAALRAPNEAAPLAPQALLPKTEWTDEQPAQVPGSASSLVVVSDRQAKGQLWVLDVAGKDPARKLPTGDAEAAAPTVSADGKWVAYTAIRRGIYLVPMEGGGEVRRVTSGPDDTCASFSRDGAWIYFTTTTPAGKRAVARVAARGDGEPEIVVTGADRPSASPTEDRVAYVALDGDSGTPTVLDLPTKKSRPLSPALGKGAYGGLRFSTDGKRVVVSIGLTDLAEVDVASGGVVRRYSSGDQVTSVTYVGRDIVVSRIAWRGDLWSARDPWRRD